ncbi:MAG: sulfurtransferase [Williamsia herbipolensis]|uniref:Thiosulfate/3-mercaptopyruvate sulfurtransferase n=1 Tax=Williamsia serinedens TaxID=391736 RepID=A0ABT1GYC1_9NOCA|nr:sulfurtransferase [Williamsia serinedens]MBE7160677.1 sulfurtransferase [Williamsia herbipolensis]MCP2159975.1 thiosulfate/3-mercaptopyruvate sulfurtransferase [Williamsia serinedens]
MDHDAVTIDADDLATRLTSADPPVVLDVRWRLGDDRGHDHFREGHIPGAVYVDLDTELAGPADPARGRHPLPDIEVLQDAARRWGVRDDRTVVAYDDNGNRSAARAWWLLRWAGVGDVRLLDGGLRAWLESGRDLHTGDGVPAAPGTATLRAGSLPTVDIDDVATFRGTLLDARAGERYRGEVEPIDPRAGHIPGAVSAPTAGNLDATGRFLQPAELRTRFAALGVDPAAPAAVYCGSGITAAHQVAALAIAGVDAALYPGSWSQWSSDPDRPAATGPQPR